MRAVGARTLAEELDEQLHVERPRAVGGAHHVFVELALATVEGEHFLLDFDDFVELLATDAVMRMPPWEYWLDGKDAVVATMRSPGTWDGDPRPGRYRIVPAPMNGEPGGLAYVRGPDGRYHAVCLTVLSLDPAGRVVELTTFVLPELFAAWGFPPVLEA